MARPEEASSQQLGVTFGNLKIDLVYFSVGVSLSAWAW